MFIEEHSARFSTNRLCEVLDVRLCGLLTFSSRPTSRRQWSDLVTLAHIKEQSRLSLGSYGRPGMTEKFEEIGLNIGHRRLGRLIRWNGIIVPRALKHTLRQRTATISLILRRTYWTVILQQMPPQKGGRGHYLYLDA